MEPREAWNYTKNVKKKIILTYLGIYYVMYDCMIIPNPVRASSKILMPGNIKNPIRKLNKKDREGIHNNLFEALITLI